MRCLPPTAPLRLETLALIDNLQKCIIEADMLYVWDLTVIKDVGLMPSWRSYPCMSERIKKLQVEIRLV